MNNPHFFLAATFMLSLAAPGAEAAPLDGAYSGSWSYAGDRGERKSRHQAIETATENLNGFIRGRARGRLKERTTPPPTLNLQVGGGRLELYQGEHKISLRLGGEPVRVDRDGKSGMLSARRDGDRLIVESKGDNGNRTTTYALSSDKQLKVSVRITGKRLDQPIVYTSTYARR